MSFDYQYADRRVRRITVSDWKNYPMYITKLSSRLSASLAIVATSTGLAFAQTQLADTPISLPPDITQFSLVELGGRDIYFPMPGNFNLEPAAKQVGPDRSWYKQTHVMRGQALDTWSEMTSLLVLPRNVPGITLLVDGLKKGCAEGFFQESVFPPKFLVPQSKVEAVLAGCKKLSGNSPFTVLSYHIAIETDQNKYVISREKRDSYPATVDDWKITATSQWQKFLSKFAVCEKGVACAGLK